MDSYQRVNNKQELINLILSNKESIKNFGVGSLGLFGSFVRNEMNEKSDIDFLIEMPKEKKTLRNLSDLYEYLIFITGRKVELVTPQSLSPYIGPHILKEVENVFR